MFHYALRILFNCVLPKYTNIIRTNFEYVFTVLITKLKYIIHDTHKYIIFE